ncbi:tetraacyldisaccharide 4'-kinase [Thiohalomonas denitrificans]|uniref:Tetraacyldisaccharide 4'-kinase n=1 Tax=Thiohalomonas denitrificans TaxID=415747 RepID=A0A1G5R1T7_9GAMM|nr:tetraacyldisaccharide 4'-kinase [Thiohalomonas denitrificans]SCZ67770.1 lipid-A-disaccharide kinase [Thiohalomonas denitrificans]
MGARLQELWYRRRLVPALWPLLPLEGLFCGLSAMRRLAYRYGVLRIHRCAVPVIVVGNLTVGGTGKTPLVARLAVLLQQAGYRPGIVSRGYGGRAREWPQAVSGDSNPHHVGDEPVLLARTTGCPVMAGPDRAAAADALVQQGVDAIISDDGLQHYRLGRSVEIAVLDGKRRAGNGHCLPAGPLRERTNRLGTVDWVVVNGEPASDSEQCMTFVPGRLHRIDGSESEGPLKDWAGKSVHAVAGIGHPERFFAMLKRAGLKVTAHPFADHHPYEPSDLAFKDDRPVLMTEKDAVKCRSFAQPHWWTVPVTAELDAAFESELLRQINNKR